MPFAAAGSEHPLPTHAVGEAIGAVLEQVGHAPDLAALFVTGPFAGAIDDMAHAVRTILSPETLIGATAVSVMAGPREIEDRAAVVLFAATWDGRMRTGARGLRTVVFDAAREDGAWRVTGSDPLQEDAGTLLLLAESSRFPAGPFLGGMASRTPGVTCVGGLTSVPPILAADRLVADDRVLDGGAVGLFIPGGAPVRAFTSQGFRPLGDTFVVTGAVDGGVAEIAGRPALEHIMETASHLDEADRRAMANGIHLGVVVDEGPGAGIEGGSVLVHRVRGADRSTGIVAVDGPVPVGSPVRVGVRDARGAAADLESVLAGASASAALLFGDRSRGHRMFGRHGHDADAVAGHIDTGAVAGMFCSGEIGPIAGRSRLQTGSITMLLLDDRAVTGAHPPPDGRAPGSVSPRRDPG